MNSKTSLEKTPETQSLLSEIFSLHNDASLLGALSAWRAHILKRSFERLAADIDHEHGLASAMVRLHHHFSVELPITEIGSILPVDEDSVKGIEDIDPKAFRSLFSVREKIATGEFDSETKFVLGEKLREHLTSKAAVSLADYGKIGKNSLEKHCPGKRILSRKTDGAFSLSSIIDKITGK